MKDRPPKIEEALPRLPQKPGVYQYFDADEKLLYVGKAKNLKKRVSSYFSKDRFENGKTALLVRKIQSLKYIVVDTEYEALLLENTLIKKHQPRFNIQLRDDKTYPWICIKNERFPRVFTTRKLIKDGSEYYGPYPSVRVLKNILSLITQLYKLRNCSFNLSDENIQAGKFRVCLEYQIGNCKGPCEGKQDEEDYREAIAQIRNLIKGNVQSVIRDLNARMLEQATNLQFEEAQYTKTRLDALEKFKSKSTVVNSSIDNVDVLTILADDKFGYVNYMRVIRGAIVQSHTIEVKKQLDERPAELLASALVEMRERFGSVSKEVLVSEVLQVEFPDLRIHVPQRGDKRRLIEFSERNARFFMMDRHKEQEKVDPDRHINRILSQMQEDLRLPELPRHIECFDNSNMQGSFPVAACVVFKNARPSKKDYRHFNIKTVEGPNDFASMEEVLHRRYKRLVDEDQPLPQLVVVDGGKGQLSSALKTLDELGLRGKISIIGIAKRLEEIFFPEDPIPIYIDKRSESLKIIQQLRNEAHRFGITHHRNRRSKGVIRTSLSDIQGIGEQTARQLLRHFKSVKRIREASEEDLAQVVTQQRAKLVYQHFNGKEE
ncbi:MAG: excinuclease ABC subunit UvrC [Salibacteraceae bacterium]